MAGWINGRLMMMAIDVLKAQRGKIYRDVLAQKINSSIIRINIYIKDRSGYTAVVQ